MPSHALVETLAGEDAECGGHMFEDVRAVFVEGWESRDNGERCALRQSFKSRLTFLRVRLSTLLHQGGVGGGGYHIRV